MPELISSPPTVKAEGEPPIRGAVTLKGGTNVILDQTGNEIEISFGGVAEGDFPTGIIDAVANGVPNDGTTDTVAAFNAILTAIGADHRELWLPAGNYRVASNITFPANVRLRFFNGAQLNPDASRTVTINGPYDAGAYRIFGGSGSIVLGENNPVVNVRHFGATGGGSIDDCGFITKAVEALGTTINRTLVLTPGTYRLSIPLSIPANINLRFEPGARFSVDSGDTLTINGTIEATRHDIVSGLGTVSILNPDLYPEWFGAKGDARRLSGLSIESGSDLLNADDPIFAATDVGKQIYVHQAGDVVENYTTRRVLITTVEAFISATQVRLVDPAPDEPMVGDDDVVDTTGGIGTDDADALNTAFRIIKNAGHGRLSLAPHARYLINASVGIGTINPLVLTESIDNFTLEGNGATIHNNGMGPLDDGETNGHFFTLRLQGNNVTVRNLDLTYSHEFDTDKDENDPTGLGGQGEVSALEVGGYGDTIYKEHILVENVRTFGAWYAGIRPKSASHVTLRNCYVEKALATGIFPGDMVEDFRVDGCTVVDTTDDGIYVGNGTSAPAVRDVAITNCTVRDVQARGIGFGGVHDGVISNNRVHNTWAAGISVDWEEAYSDEGNRHIKVSENIVKRSGKNFATGKHHTTASSTGHGIYSFTATPGMIDYLEITNNQIYESNSGGIAAVGQRHLRVQENTVHSALGTGIEIGSPVVEGHTSVLDFRVDNNVVKDVIINGIVVSRSSYGSVSNNQVREFGTLLETVTKPIVRGIQVFYCDYVNMVGNQVRNDRNYLDANIITYDLTGSTNTTFQSGLLTQEGSQIGEATVPSGAGVYAGKWLTFLNALPTTGTWNVGDTVINSQPANGEALGWICTVAGTAGTLSSVTGSIDNSSTELTVDTVVDLYAGQYITIPGVTGTKIIRKIVQPDEEVDEWIVYLNTAANAGVGPVAISFSNPTFAAIGTVGGAGLEESLASGNVATRGFGINATPDETKGDIVTINSPSVGGFGKSVITATGAGGNTGGGQNVTGFEANVSGTASAVIAFRAKTITGDVPSSTLSVGVFIDPIVSGATKYGIYQLGPADKNMFLGPVCIGNEDTYITRHMSGTTAWSAPAGVADNAMISKDVTVAGATLGDTVNVGLTQALPAGAILSGAVTGANTVTVTLLNRSGEAIASIDATLRADCWKH